MNEKKFDLEERLIDFAVEIVFFVESLPNTKSANHPGGQLLRSGTSPALSYGEAKGTESKSDFLHKMKVCLKELRESLIGLRILYKAKMFKSENQLKSLITECNELISIFAKSIDTATKSKLITKNK